VLTTQKEFEMTNARGVARAVYLLAYAGPVIQGIPVDPVGALHAAAVFFVLPNWRNRAGSCRNSADCAANGLAVELTVPAPHDS
jgi:hypothetical protein